MNNYTSKYTKEEIKKFREAFQKRKSQRITLFIITMMALLAIGFVLLPLMDMIGINRRIWAPIAYVLFFGLILLSAYVWRCPACKSQLGDIFSTKYCSKCGLRFYNDK